MAVLPAAADGGRAEVVRCLGTDADTFCGSTLMVRRRPASPLCAGATTRTGCGVAAAGARAGVTTAGISGGCGCVRAAEAGAEVVGVAEDGGLGADWAGGWRAGVATADIGTACSARALAAGVLADGSASRDRDKLGVALSPVGIGWLFMARS